ncbi:MAG: ABC transporter permease subunit, partial [Synergistaceae bacterium]|nr:ABC transporter permease subunit [Synergistaceae bacterium]
MKFSPRAADFIFIAAIAATLLYPSAEGMRSAYTAVLLIVIQLVFIAKRFFDKDGERVAATGDALAVVYVLLFLWELATAKLNILDSFLYPSPGVVVRLFIDEMPALVKGLLSSLRLLFCGYLLAVAVAVPAGLYFGYKRRLKLASKPFAKVLGPIPPLVYIPYAIAVLPTFLAASIFIIFIGAFWPIFINTMNGVSDIDRKVTDTAKTLRLSDRQMIFLIILPGSISSIMSGANIGLSFSFILLTSAEMIGGTSGMGWYVKYFSDFANYPKVIVGIV